MIGTLVLYGFALVGVLATVTAVGVLVFTWRLPAATLPGEESPSPAEVIAGHTRGNVRVLPQQPLADWERALLADHTLDVPCWCGRDHNPAGGAA